MCGKRGLGCLQIGPTVAHRGCKILMCSSEALNALQVKWRWWETVPCVATGSQIHIKHLGTTSLILCGFAAYGVQAPSCGTTNTYNDSAALPGMPGGRPRCTHGWNAACP